MTSTGTAYCSQCGGQFAVDDMIRHANLYVCANCKPVFMQKLIEGADIQTGDLRFAGFWLRVGAAFVDGIIMLIVNFGMSLVFLGSLIQDPNAPDSAANTAIVLGLYAAQLGVGFAYEVIMIGKYGATLGKMACKIKVVTPEGGPVSYVRAVGRYFAKFLSGLILGIGYLMAAFDDQKRSLHDRICNTRVVFK